MRSLWQEQMETVHQRAANHHPQRSFPPSKNRAPCLRNLSRAPWRPRQSSRRLGPRRTRALAKIPQIDEKNRRRSLIISGPSPLRLLLRSPGAALRFFCPEPSRRAFSLHPAPWLPHRARPFSPRSLAALTQTFPPHSATMARLAKRHTHLAKENSDASSLQKLLATSRASPPSNLLAAHSRLSSRSSPPRNSSCRPAITARKNFRRATSLRHLFRLAPQPHPARRPRLRRHLHHQRP